ncbi:MAG: carboxypeptidase-like regulatory domain-containing protein [Armatimonadota bacterium]
MPWSVAQAQSADIAGRVLDADGKPVSGATVYCARNLFVLSMSLSAEDIPHVVTDTNGNFRFQRTLLTPKGLQCWSRFILQRVLAKCIPSNASRATYA